MNNFFFSELSVCLTTFGYVDTPYFSIQSIYLLFNIYTQKYLFSIQLIFLLASIVYCIIVKHRTEEENIDFLLPSNSPTVFMCSSGFNNVQKYPIQSHALHLVVLFLVQYRRVFQVFISFNDCFSLLCCVKYQQLEATYIYYLSFWKSGVQMWPGWILCLRVTRL